MLARVIVSRDGAGTDEEANPAIIATFQHFGSDQSLPDTQRLAATAFVKDALRPSDHISGNKVLFGNPYLHAKIEA